ncbi:hypothetical protein FH608_044215 [Nonomuraea phyllanthi]|uniref:Uncharacterized protein n=1 Tax=Nonomuraea phyllanthi TaxID=2219224 RepID=A0A5C4VD02_9ACTN|nr:hypothetical protein [Nonomuraea phyllanthi]KAB8188447.1 hypothetical protein FH608_044215 [Nonomuraea phyllanthi]QFY09813.1 hypothetical protein GBF35_27015 [Nonomuraea phyllanthi]
MSWTLETPDGRTLSVNAWNWRPALELLESAGVLDAETAELLGYNILVELGGEDARRIAAFLDSYLSTAPAGGRVLLDGSVTTEPDTFEFHRDDLARNYSATVEWLTRFRDFCHAATNGFTCC